MYDLARPCQELQEKRTKRVLVQKNLSGKIKNLVKKSKKCQEYCQEIQQNSRNPGKPKKRREKARYYWMIMNENAWKGLILIKITLVSTTKIENWWTKISTLYWYTTVPRLKKTICQLVPNFVFYCYNVINLIQQFGSKILLESFPDFIFDIFLYFRRKFYYKQNSFHTNAPGWCLMKCINYHRLATCSFHLTDFLTRILPRISKIFNGPR